MDSPHPKQMQTRYGTRPSAAVRGLLALFDETQSTLAGQTSTSTTSSQGPQHPGPAPGYTTQERLTAVRARSVSALSTSTTTTALSHHHPHTITATTTTGGAQGALSSVRTSSSSSVQPLVAFTRSSSTGSLLWELSGVGRRRASTVDSAEEVMAARAKAAKSCRPQLRFKVCAPLCVWSWCACVCVCVSASVPCLCVSVCVFVCVCVRVCVYMCGCDAERLLE